MKLICKGVVTIAVLMANAPTLAAQQPAKWRLVEEWRVGGEVEGPHSFTDVRGLAVFADGRIVVLDAKDQKLHILGADGKPMRTVGRKGAGPGEMSDANGVLVSPRGEIIVNDPQGNNRFTLYSSSGDFVKTIPMTNLWGYGYVWSAYFNSAGLLDEYVSVRKGGDAQSTPARRVWSLDFSRIDTVMPPACALADRPDPDNLRFRFVNASGGTTMLIPNASPGTPVATASDGAGWAGTFPGYATIRRTPAGKCEGDVSIQLKGARIAVPSATRDSDVVRVQQAAARRGMTADVSKIPREYPAYDALYVDPAQRLWVERYTDRPGRRLEIFSNRGVQIAELDTPMVFRRSPAPVVTNERILAFVSDEDGLAYLVSLRIVRN
ncbi:MAG TPA: 6-bladed beta-propeller [Gemmatimonadaceae bacterium]|nr:6-bladed beta-propeller [Gemmatimonadaceae bacterium]